MKNLFYYIMLVVLVASCSPEEFSAPANLTADDLDWGITETDVVNEYILYNNTSGVTSKWDLGNGVTLEGDSAVAQYAFAGDYDITLLVISQGGTLTVEDKISTDQDNPSFLSGYPYDELTGGSEKVWAVDAFYKGHFGLGPSLEEPFAWWSAGVNEKADLGFYDDRFTFSISESGLTMLHETNGDVYSNGQWASALGDSTGHKEPNGGDYIMPYDGGSYVISVAGEKLTYEIGGFIGYYAGANEFDIVTLEEDLLELAYYDTKNGFWWYTQFRPVDALTPEPEENPKEVKEMDIYDTFEGDGNIVWATADIQEYKIIENFAPVPVNETDSVARYTKGAGEWTNVSTELTHIMDLSNRNVFTMKVYIPNYNDYVTECNPGTDWLTEHNLKPQVDVKLQNSLLGGNAWETQEVRSHIVTEDNFGKWIDLEFDFSDVTDRVDFDKIVIQLGAEGHCNEGIFYLDEFILQ